MPLRFEKITTHKKRFLDLLLLADEQESMIDRYLERGEMFVARDDGQVVAECVVTDEADRIGEIKNLAVPLQYQRIRTTNARISGSALPGSLPDASRRHRGCSPHTPFLRTMRIRSLALDPRLLHRSLRPPHHRRWQATGRYGLSEEVLVTRPVDPATQKIVRRRNPIRSGYFSPESSEILFFLIPSRQDNYETHS